MPKSSRTSASHIQDYGPVEERREDFADTSAQFLTMKQDMDATPLFKGLPEDKCSCPHWGYVFKGRLTFDCGDHEEVFEAGDAFYPRLGTSRRALSLAPSTSSSARPSNCRS